MSKFRILTLNFSLLLITGILVLAINWSASRMNGIIKENHLHATGQIKNAPPMVVFTTVALGSFRGILADILWLRAASLQDSGNYFEMVQLAYWITELQPRFSGATAYLAWNMAYNISVTCSQPEDRWRWIQEGIRLIRDKAIDYNPSDPLIYKELGWIFQHKVGNVLDDAHKYYKNHLAIDMENVIGAKPDWDRFAAAPKDEAAFKAIYTGNNPFWVALNAAGFASLDALYEEFTKNNGTISELLLKEMSAVKSVVDIEHYLRRQWLYKKFRLESDLIKRINQQYGQLDWRLPEAQSIYWATKGLEMTIGNRDLSCERMITQALKDAFVSGRLLWLDRNNYENIILAPNFNVIDSVADTFEKAYQENNKQSSFRSAKINFFKEAITLLYNYGMFSKAEDYYKKLKREEPGAHRMRLDEFVMKEWAEDVRSASVKQATDIIAGFIFRACNYIVLGDDDAALAQERMARYIYNNYSQYNADIKQRVGLASYAQIKKSVTDACLQNYPPAMAAILRERLAQEAAARGEKSAEPAARSGLPFSNPLLPAPAR
ncbi:MAG: hypothetical protein PHV75_00405 [Victivallaceae bacterium]|jgi:hypothetical protein|nr:hypothetical protein [Victivallaceae bacterium]NLK83523.1 hypothetical protein [Lentisphaerota bacterium]MDD3115778.1 hypothetical protein [Victivallaceae bacterium]MDD3703399.1 hypothetical protein [Victivallaceae bacterium]MDD4316960.1 hypothetical protein [Victivallaceae bacterium]